MMPDERPGQRADERISVVGIEARGVWRTRVVDGDVTLFVERGEVVVRLPDHEELVAPLHALTGTEWRAETLTLHAAGESLQLTGARELGRAWLAITSGACLLPEMTRGLRAMGGRHGASGELQARYFAPLLQARRRLETAEPMDWRLGGFDARALDERLRATLSAVAAEHHPERAAHRRALEAELLDAAEPVFERLAQLSTAAAAVHDAPDAVRFVAWRAWVGALRRLFIEADRSWGAIRHAVQAPPDRPSGKG